MRDFANDFKEVRRRLDEAKGYLRIEHSRMRLVELEAEIGRPDLWDDQENAKRVNTEYANAKSDVDQYDRLMSETDDLEVLSEMAREEGDESQEPEIDAGIASVAAELATLELRSLFTGEHDADDVIVQINAKDGDRKSTRLNSSHVSESRMPSSA